MSGHLVRAVESSSKCKWVDNIIVAPHFVQNTKRLEVISLLLSRIKKNE